MLAIRFGYSIRNNRQKLETYNFERKPFFADRLGKPVAHLWESFPFMRPGRERPIGTLYQQMVFHV